jgi:hypothetical protein
MRTSLSRVDNGQRDGRTTATASDQQSGTIRARGARKSTITVALLLTAATSAPGESPSWPPFLPSPDTFAPDLRASIERVWVDPTLSRRVAGRPAGVPFDIYIAFVDAPDVTAAAARLLQLAPLEVRALDESWYEADDHDGARGVYRVIARTETRRVMISWGRHRGWLLGTISGSALTVLDLRARDGRVDQSLTAYVRIDNAVVAAHARLLVPSVGGLAGPKLSGGFAGAASVAEWAVEHPTEFCDWLRREPLPANRKDPMLLITPRCR